MIFAETLMRVGTCKRNSSDLNHSGLNVTELFMTPTTKESLSKYITLAAGAIFMSNFSAICSNLKKLRETHEVRFDQDFCLFKLFIVYNGRTVALA